MREIFTHNACKSRAFSRTNFSFSEVIFAPNFFGVSKEPPTGKTAASPSHQKTKSLPKTATPPTGWMTGLAALGKSATLVSR
jgi:hypothetical protein